MSHASNPPEAVPEIPKPPSIDQKEIRRLVTSGKSGAKAEIADQTGPSQGLIDLDFVIGVILRVILTTVIISIMCWWMSFIKKTIQNQAWNNQGFHLADGTMMTLLTTTTGNILIMMYSIVNYFFPKKNEIAKLRKKGK